MIKPYIVFALVSVCLSTSVHALGGLQAYWNMNAGTVSGKLTPNDGEQAGTLGASIFDAAVGFYNEIQADVDGTLLNIPAGDSTPAGYSVGFYRFGDVYADGSFTMQGFNFSKLSDAVISFAYQSDTTFVMFSDLQVRYDLNDGNGWVNATSDESYQTGWNIVDVELDAVAGYSNVDLQIRTVDWVDISSFLDIDNVQVNAVPEPRTVALLLGSSVLGLAFWRRRKRA